MDPEREDYADPNSPGWSRPLVLAIAAALFAASAGGTIAWFYVRDLLAR
jgi:hypothetical protein